MTVLFRTGSGSIPVESPLVSGSHRLSAARTSGPTGEKSGAPSPIISMKAAGRIIRRCSSSSDVVALEMRSLSRLGSRSFPARIPEEEFLGPGFNDGGMNKTRTPRGGGGRRGSGGDGSKMGSYYQEMLKSDPTNSLLLRNYAKYLHEVLGDVVKAEEYYGRAILASPGDGEVLSLYGKLIWETQRDEDRAKSYFHQALHASPHDCVVLGSYARFLWESEEENEEENEDQLVSTAAMVAAF